MSLLGNMLQRALCSNVPRLSGFLRSARVNKYSNVSNEQSQNEDNVSEKVENEEGEGETLSGEEKVSRLLNESATFSDAKDESWATTPYPKEVVIPGEKKKEKPKIDPSETSTFVFPGQGILKAGMVKKYLRFPGAKDLFDIANEILGYDLLKLCLQGPQQKLDKTQFNQVATVVTSLAALEKLREERPRVFETCVGAAGYSVGEISALIFSGAISVEDGIRLVSVRGTAMQYAAEKVPQGMMSVYCRPQAKMQQIFKEAKEWAENAGVSDPVCQTAIYLYTQGKILAGHDEALKYIEKNSERLGLSKVRRLPVSGAFHTPLMEPALHSFKKMLSQINIEAPRCTLYTNVTGTPYSDPMKIRRYLIKQIVTSVKWEQTMQMMFHRPPDTPFPRIFDLASDGRMKLILRQINAKACDSCIVV